MVSTTEQRTFHHLRDLVPLIRQAEGFAAVLTALSSGASATIDGAWGSSCALVAAALAQGTAPLPGTAKPRRRTRKKAAVPLETVADSAASRIAVDQPSPAADSTVVPPVLLIVLPRIADIDDFAIDLAGFLDQTPLIFPAWESLPQGETTADPVFSSRLQILRHCWQAADAVADSAEAAANRHTSPEPRVIITSLPALLQPVPSRAEIERCSRWLSVGEQLDPDNLLRWLVDQGFERVAGIQLPGEFSVHGGIVDLFPPTETNPLRIEFFGDEIESIRRFDVETQRKVEDLRKVSLTLLSFGQPADPADSTAADNGAPRAGSEFFNTWSSNLAESLPAGSWVMLGDLPELVSEGRQFLERLDNPRGLFGVEAALAKCAVFPHAFVSAIAADGHETSCHLPIHSIERFDVSATQVIDELVQVVGDDEHVLIACHNEGEQQRLTELMAPTTLLSSGRVQFCQGFLLRGFRMLSERLIVLSDHELFGRRDIRRATPKAGRVSQLETRAIDSFLELNPGDLVVHLTKGIARFRGMQLLTKADRAEEHLTLEFRDNVKVYVPVTLIHLVQKYVGGGKLTPQLSKLGTTSWEKKKAAVASAVIDLASDMIRLQADREAKPGFAYPLDTRWQQEFEAAFPYTATVDQVTSIVSIKSDMMSPRPMDRLICGDVGYGKTEVAMRGAFKAIDSGKQVAMLVPTTVLAEQHFRTFRERMAEFPFSIEVLSRFRTRGEQKTVLEGLAAGSVDLVIGTHRLISPDVKFKDLGLLVIDEEQRFGVEAKEVLKRLRLEVDVLTMSATPIPRTLHLSLLGIRDISNLQTPPHDRQAIETRVVRWDGSLIRQAIVRELNRGGQVYFVHNRVYNIHEITDRLQSIVPEARFGIVHGQMPEHELEDSMVAFVNGQVDVLVATTIIESGLDIPNANTIFIHQADKYGLSELHQLRGRVGRYKHRAHCYLVLEEGRSLTTTAARRLKAIEEFSELGAGFKIAMRDLEIRGAGNILGTEQSGHIATVGYELYCHLLENAVRGLKKLPARELPHVALDLPISGYLPDTYIPPGRQKIDLYRKLSRVETRAHLEEVADELRDRFGPIPEDVENLFRLKELQLLARGWQIDDIHLEEHFIVLKYRNETKIGELAVKSGGRLRIVDRRSAYLPFETSDPSPEELLQMLTALLGSDRP